ncbi:MAG TPA: phosphoribosyltransferase family protein [Bacteroidota bacterium]|nr:phosphoribosyltransferase family protein [Bacteroidota bacterium]
MNLHWTLLRRLIEPVGDVLFPPLCTSCSDRLADSSDRYICVRCRRRLTRVLATDRTMCVLMERFTRGGSIGAFTPLYYFEDRGVLQSVIHALKYREMTGIGRVFGQELGALLRTLPQYQTCDLIVPIPLHIQKERERGYNQSDYICRGIADVLHLPVETRAMRRIKKTRTQTKLSVTERTENVSGAFAVEDKARRRIRGHSVILVDDVVTTGATVQSCAAAMMDAGAHCVLCASIGAAMLDEMPASTVTQIE